MGKEEFPVVTIVTIVYNDVSNIEKTLRSVTEQTYSNIEYIIIDGGSTDGTVEIIKKYDKRISYWHSKGDKGIYDAMNQGISQASGKWINFMNSGDVFCKDTSIQELANKKLLDLTGTIICGNRILNKDGVYIKQKCHLHSLRYIMEIYHQACFIPTSLHKEYLFDTTYRITGDYDFFYRMNNKNIKFLKVDDYICTFLYGGFSSNLDLQFEEVKRVIGKNNSIFKRELYLLLCHVRYWYYLFQKHFPKGFLFTRTIYRRVKI